jgi:hypothetical protein
MKFGYLVGDVVLTLKLQDVRRVSDVFLVVAKIFHGRNDGLKLVKALSHVPVGSAQNSGNDVITVSNIALK